MAEQNEILKSKEGIGQGQDPNFDRKLDAITAGAKPFVKHHLLTRITRKNCETIVTYILAMQTEVSPSQTYRIDTINKLTHFAKFHHTKAFKAISRQDIIDFLDSFRKPESVDHLHKWVGTYENNRVVLLRFFRWLYYMDIEPKKRPKPDVMQNIPPIKRKETSIYKPTDLWTEEDDELFYRHCPYPRDRCWHAVARDTGCRPHEMLKMKIKDVVVQQLQDSKTGQTYQIARITVNGKTGTRHVRLYHSYPRLKDWLSNGHPFPGVPDVPVFGGTGKKNTGRRLSEHAMNAMYDRYKKTYFPQLLQSPTVSEEDKRKIRDLLKKPWNPYVRRHTAATEISKILKDSVLIDQYMGWSHAGNTRQKYQHYMADDAFDAMITLADGLISPNSPSLKGKKSPLRPRLCPNCDESNKPEARFCTKCKFVLSWDVYNESIQTAEQSKQETQEMKQQLVQVKADVDKLIKQAVKEKEIEDSLSLANPENLEQAIRDFLLVDESEETGEPYYRQDYPELLEVLEKLSTRRLASDSPPSPQPSS